MTDESRAASVPEPAEPLDGVAEAGPGATAARSSVRPPAGDAAGEGEAAGAEARSGGSSPSRRPRMALRIPDDEVARPEARSPEAPERPPVSEPPPASDGAAVIPVRIISINPPPVAEADNDVAVGPLPPPRLPPLPAPPSPVTGETPPAATGGDAVGTDDDWSDDRPTPVPARSATPESPPATPPAPSPPAVAEPQGDEVRFEEVRLDEEAPTPALPPVAAQAEPEPTRRSEPGDAPEVSPEDLVAVEAAPVRTSVRPGPPKKPPKPPLVIVPPHVGALAPQPAAEPAAGKRKGRLWWEDFFNDDYVRTMERITPAQIAREVKFIEESLGVERGAAILDLACGTGRHAVELGARGYEVVGFDLSLAMLSRAGDEAQDRGVKLNLVQGDMREMSFEEQFDGVFCWNTSFGYFEEEKNALVVARVHRALKAGGRFLLDVVNRDFLTRQAPSLAWFEGDGCVCMDDMNLDFITSRIRVKRTMMLDDGRTREIEYSIRTYGLHELGKILHDSGFKVCEVSGRIATPGVFFGNESPRTIILAEKR